uniref:Uncharacterized protein n=1 Tax=Anguilla anguilla TaxID=7936 RepID=A0A0E9SBL8_ANGAN
MLCNVPLQVIHRKVGDNKNCLHLLMAL